MKIILVILLPLLAGCLGPKGVIDDQEFLPVISDKPLSLVIHDSPDFLAITPERDMFTIDGFNEAANEGNRLVADAGIEDPAGEISREMARAISRHYDLQYSQDVVKKSKSKKVKDLANLAHGRGYILAIETLGWMFTYDVSDDSDYSVRYTVRMRLINAEKAATIEQSSCRFDTTRAGIPAVSHEELVGDDAAWIKEALTDAAESCVNRLTAELP